MRTAVITRTGTSRRNATPAPGPTVAVLLALALIVGLAGCGGTAGVATPDRAQLTALLARLGSAVLHRHRGEFLGGFDDAPAANGFRVEQGAEFANLRQLPLEQWNYRLVAPVTQTDVLRSARARFGAGATIWQLSLTYRLRGYDPAASQQSLWWTFVRRDGRLVVASDDALVDDGGVSWQGPWDFGPMSTVRTRDALVLGEADQTPVLQQIASVVGAAVPRVSAIWGTAWTQRVVVIVPATAAGLQAALGDATPDTADGAVTGGDVAAQTVFEQSAGGVKVARVVVVPGVFARLSAFGRAVVLTHELTHVATGADTDDGTPRWLVEGFADFVAYLHADRPVTTIAAELASAVRSGHTPQALPDEAEFDHASTSASAYEQAWLACRLIARRAGAPALVRVYRAVGTGRATVAEALRAALGESGATFVRQWRAYLRTELSR